MRRSANIVTGRWLSLNCFLLSLCLNLAFLLVLSGFREHVVPEAEDAMDVKFVSLPQTRLQRRSLAIPREQMTLSVPRDVEQSAARTEPVVLTREIVSAQTDSPTPVEIDNTTSEREPELLSAITSRRDPTSPLSAPTGAAKRGAEASLQSARSGTGGYTGPVGRGITPRKPLASIGGAGDKIRGYYNISLVRYEDTSDTISTDALRQLAGAMNRWTEIRTKVIKEPMMLDDPELLRVPMVYITSRRAFAFSERERENLRKYLAAGGFLLFSNTAASESEARGVANSIEFELWKVLNGAAADLFDLDESHELYGSFFDLDGSLDLLGIALDDRLGVIYEDRGYGNAWVAGENKREPYMKLGVNIIAYALTTSPIVMRY